MKKNYLEPAIKAQTISMESSMMVTSTEISKDPVDEYDVKDIFVDESFFE